MSSHNDIGLAALELDCKLDAVQAFAYRLIFNDLLDQEQIPFTRRGARQLRFANGYVPITDFGAWSVASLSRLGVPTSEWGGVRCTVIEERPIVLHSDNEKEREAIQRLLNQALMQGAKDLAYASQGRLDAGWSSERRVELMDLEPSERVPIHSDYLKAFKRVVLTPEILPDGTALVCFNVHHRLLPPPSITMDWVIRNKPGWLKQEGIRVRHRYESPGKGYLTAEWIGVADGVTPMSTFQTPQGEISYFDYHKKLGHIPPGEEEHALTTQVVNVCYKNHKKESPVQHLASLLQPMFDFETLRYIDSRLLERIARKLKWSVDDRLRATNAVVRDLQIPYWNAKLRRIERIESHTLSLKPKVRLRFAQGQYADNEKEVTRLGAYRSMTRKLVVPAVVGDAREIESAKRHFSKVEKICNQWSGGESTAWNKSPLIVNDATELDNFLSKKDSSNAILLIGITKQANECANKCALRGAAFRNGLATQFMLLDHEPGRYQPSYYNNLAAGLFSKAGGILCALEDIPGDTELFVGLDLGGIEQRAPGMAFLFTREGTHLGWQLADIQKGERLGDEVLKELLERSLGAFRRAYEGRNPKRITLHRDGRFFEALDVLLDFEQNHGIGVDVLEIIKSGSPPLFRRSVNPKGKAGYINPEVGDAFLLKGLDELIVSTYSGEELGPTWGKSVTVRPLRLRKRYGATDLLVLAQQVILLSRIHGASLYRHPRLPVTTHHADRFATLRQECNLEDLSRMDRLCPVYL